MGDTHRSGVQETGGTAVAGRRLVPAPLQVSHPVRGSKDNGRCRAVTFTSRPRGEDIVVAAYSMVGTRSTLLST